MNYPVTHHENNVINPALTGILAKTSTEEVDAVLQQSRVAPEPVSPSISPATTFVVVPKPYTTPARVPILLQVSGEFKREGLLSPSGNRDVIKIFKTPTGGVPLKFDGKDNEFHGLELEAGVRVFAEGVKASTKLDDFILTLDLAPGPTDVGPPATATLTAVELTLDICGPRTAPNVEPPVMPQPITSQPPSASAPDKWFGGRLVNEQDIIVSQERAMLIVRQPKPAAFTGQLVLRGVEVTGSTVGKASNKARLFTNETPNLIQLALNNPHQFSGVSPNGLRFFVQGSEPSFAARDMGFQLGIAGVEDDGDRVAVTVGVAPVIAMASSAIVVKKQPMNPARKAIRLSTSSAFSGTGTLSRSGNTAAIKLFKPDGTELSFATDPVFTDLELSGGGFQLLAEGVAPSGQLNDYQLTLSLTGSGSVQAGNPVTVKMTAFEFRLDVAVSRTAPGVDPAVLPQPPPTPPAPGTVTDKVNLGRFVQVRDPGFSHERAMLIIRRSNPEGFVGTLVLTPINAQVQAFVAEAPATGQTQVTMPFTVAANNIPANGTRLFVEATSVSAAVRDTGFQLGIQNLEPQGDRVLMTAVQFDLTLTAGDAVAATSFVRFGLWDKAFDPANGNLLNGATDATHFIGADTRRFLFRVRDPNATTPQLEWRTVKADNTDDHAPAAQPLQLQQTAPNSRLFFSSPVFLVTDEIDRQLQNSGLTVPAVNLLLPRIRKVTVDATHQLDGKVAATYSPAAGQTLRNATVLFARTPEERKRLRVHLVSVRASVGAAGVLSAARKTRATDLFRSLYAVCGIYADVIQAEIVIDPPASCLAWPTVYPGNAAFLAGPVVEGFGFVGNNLVPSASQLDIITVVRNLAGFAANDIYLVFVNRILAAPLPAPPPPPPVGTPPAAVAFQQNGGESFPDSFTAVGSLARGFTFVWAIVGSNNVEVHETTHVTTDLRNNAGGHYDLGLPRTAVPSPTTPGNVDGKNLMHRFPPAFATSVLDPKRLWNTEVTNSNYNPALVIPAQIDAIRSSRFVQNF